MYIKKIILKDIRGFRNLEFDLQRQDGSYAGWTVFTGDNGSGKSTLLKAIAVALTGKDIARALQPTFHRWIREGAESTEATIELEIVSEQNIDSYTEKGQTGYKKPFPAKIILKNAGKETVIEASTNTKKPWRNEAYGRLTLPVGFPALMGPSVECLAHLPKRRA